MSKRSNMCQRSKQGGASEWVIGISQQMSEWLSTNVPILGGIEPSWAAVSHHPTGLPEHTATDVDDDDYSCCNPKEFRLPWWVS